MANLRNISVVFNHIIKWLPYKPRKQGPTQCYNCGMFGHGASFCHRPAVCLLCSGEHTTKECHIKKGDNNIDQHAYKCVNCIRKKIQHNHKATDSSCPVRAEYSSIRSKINTKTSATNNRSTMKHNAQTFQPAPTPPPLSHSFARTLRSNNNNKSSNTGFSSNASSASSSSSSTRSDYTHSTASEQLWTFAEISNILLDSLNALSQCKTKTDQLKVITGLLQHVV